MPDILAKIREERANRPATWRRIADYFLENYGTASRIRMEDLRRELSVSDGSIINFVRSVGCEGFTHFKVLLAQAEGKLSERYVGAVGKSDGTYPSNVGKGLAKMGIEAKATIDDLIRGVPPTLPTRFAEAIVRARQVVIMGKETSGSIAEIFAGYLLLLGIPCHAVKDSHAIALTAQTLSKGDLMIAISYSGATPDIVTATEIAVGRGATIASVTSFVGSRVAERSEIAMVIPSKEATRGEFPAIARVGQLVIINAVCAEVARLKTERRSEYADIQ